MTSSEPFPHTRLLFDDWASVAERLKSAPLIALFLDFDGTLAPLQPRPEHVSLDDSMRQALTALVKSPRFRVWIISGRRREDICSRICVDGIRYLGLHGWEGRAGSSLEDETRRWLSSFTLWLESKFKEIPGIWIEDKEHALAIHYRDASESDAKLAHTILEKVIAPFEERFRIENGKSVWELLPRELEDKGVAVKHELHFLDNPAIPIYVGDDQVDESAFAALSAGVTVRVGASGPTHAQYRLPGVPQVQTFLQRLREFA